ncbi:NAD kinase [Reichenbachiella agarivorans]|uniref:NAD kinase n=1 Tax=Reichenbachiella agarivorans TaxID=2979464 RepID=A0ABY6CT53_9BACT|nr:NAD kinase [Reichenbachiella agarivorans]UXP33702.1 NAD kinase [Reichenbachiella agarivorans]
MRIALHGRINREDSLFYLDQIIEQIQSNNSEIVFSPELFQSAKAHFKTKQFEVIDSKFDSSTIDYYFSLGGDGTLLETVSKVGSLQTPILGINLGKLGFLATINKKDIEPALNSFFAKEFSFDDRMLIHLDSNNSVFEGQNFALNEVAVLKRDTSSMIIVHCYIDGEFVNTYWADGLMVSTPTGSTGYSLSAGGPLVLPQSDSFIITPVSPHNLNVRPLIVSGSSIISFEIEGKGRSFLTSLDSRSYKVDNSVSLSVRKESFSARLIKLNGYNFFDTLRTKLNWGLDIRN